MSEKESGTFFDHFGRDKPTKFGWWIVKSTSKKIFDFAQIGKGTRVLEIGPGRGTFADICIAKGAEYVGIEPNDKMADSLEQRGVKVLRNMVPPIPQIDKNFDVVVMSNVMEHMNTMAPALELSQEVYSLLDPAGKFVVYSPDYIGWKHHFFQEDFSHNYITTMKRLQSLLVNAGFKKTETMYLSGPFSGILCFLLSRMARLLPFGFISMVFTKSKIANKLYKLQVSFLRNAMVCGEKKS